MTRAPERIPPEGGGPARVVQGGIRGPLRHRAGLPYTPSLELPHEPEFGTVPPVAIQLRV